MTIAEILDQAKALSPQERKELAKLLIDTLEPSESPVLQKTGAEIVDTDIEDTVEWIKAQRHKRTDKLNPYRDDAKY